MQYTCTVQKVRNYETGALKKAEEMIQMFSLTFKHNNNKNTQFSQEEGSIIFIQFVQEATVLYLVRQGSCCTVPSSSRELQYCTQFFQEAAVLYLVRLGSCCTVPSSSRKLRRCSLYFKCVCSFMVPWKMRISTVSMLLFLASISSKNRRTLSSLKQKYY